MRVKSQGFNAPTLTAPAAQLGTLPDASAPRSTDTGLAATATAVLGHHAATCDACTAGLEDCEAGSRALRAMCPDGQAVMRDIVRLRLGREVPSPTLALVPVAS